jgi:hypothetical protein
MIWPDDSTLPSLQLGRTRNEPGIGKMFKVKT